MMIDSPHAYSNVAAGLMKELGIHPVALSKPATSRSSTNRLAPRHLLRQGNLRSRTVWWWAVRGAMKEARARGTISLLRRRSPTDAQADILRIEEGETDYYPELSSAEKKDRLSRISYRDYLANVVKAGPEALAFYQTITHGEWGVGIDAEPALDCWGFGLPGFRGLKLAPGSAPRMGYTASGYADGGSPTFHFPDGNATIARLLIRALIPDAMPGHTASTTWSRRKRIMRRSTAPVHRSRSG